MTPSKEPTGLDGEQSDVELVKKYCQVQNGENDLRQYCVKQLFPIRAYREMYRKKGEGRYEKVFRDSFSDLYYVLHAVELIAAREPAAAQPVLRPNYLNREQREYLLLVAGMVKGRNEQIRDVVFRLTIPLPVEIRSVVEEAIGSVQQMSPGDRAKRMVDFADQIRREHNIPISEAIHDRPELFQRTFGVIDAAISAWSEKGSLPNPTEIRTAMETGLIYTHYLYM
jgi:phage-related protein